MRSATYYAAALLAAISAASAQSVKGTAYGFASGVTGGGSAKAVTPSSAAELAKLLSDDTARVILIDKVYDFTGTTTTEAGCDKISCRANNGGQLYIGDLSCGTSDKVAVSSITYDAAGTAPLAVGSNKSIISSNGKGVLKGKGLAITPGSSNIIIQGIEFTDINPEYVWGGDALDLQGNNDGVWVDHCKFSLTGRMFVVAHYNPSRLTLSNNEFDGKTSTSATCNGNHYWTMMFLGDGDQVTFDRNYFHDVSGRAPKLGQPGVSGTFQATNNYYYNMQGHAFDAYDGASALIEGNAFASVDTPLTEETTTVDTVFNAASATAARTCSSSIGRACVVNSLVSSGAWTAMSSTSGLSAFAAAKASLVTPVAASEVAALVLANAGPAKLASYAGYARSGSSSDSGGSSSASGSSIASPSATANASVVARPMVSGSAGPSGLPVANGGYGLPTLPAATGGPVPYYYGGASYKAEDAQLAEEVGSTGSSTGSSSGSSSGTFSNSTSGSSSSSSRCAGKRRRFRA